MPWVIDLDGVMWLGDQPIAGSAAAARSLTDRGESILFVTNNASTPVETVEAKLAAQGVEAEGLVLTSALAAATLVQPGSRVLVVGGSGLVVAMEERGVEVVSQEAVGTHTPDAVVVGFTRQFDFDLLTTASRAIQDGAVLIGANTDPTFPTPDGQIPGCGAILAAVATASGCQPIVAGKPHEPMAALVRERLGAEGVVVGDRPATDGAFARTLGYRFALVWSGVTEPGTEGLEPAPDLTASDLAALVTGSKL